MGPTARAKKAVYHHWSTASPTQQPQEASQSTLIHQIDFRTFPNDGPSFGPAVRAKKAIYHQPSLEATSPKPQTSQSTLVSHLDFLNYQVDPSENSLSTTFNVDPTPEQATWPKKSIYFQPETTSNAPHPEPTQSLLFPYYSPETTT